MPDSIRPPFSSTHAGLDPASSDFERSTLRASREFRPTRANAAMNFFTNSRVPSFVELAAFVEQFRGAADIGFRLLHHRDVEEDERLAQVMVRAEPADRAGRDADHRARLAGPRALAVRPRADVDRVLEHARHRAVVFRRDEKQRVGAFHFGRESRPRRGRIAFVVVFVVERELSDLDDLEVERCGCDLCCGMRHQRLYEPLRRLPTITATFVSCSSHLRLKSIRTTSGWTCPK